MRKIIVIVLLLAGCAKPKPPAIDTRIPPDFKYGGGCDAWMKDGKLQDSCAPLVITGEGTPIVSNPKLARTEVKKMPGEVEYQHRAYFETWNLERTVDGEMYIHLPRDVIHSRWVIIQWQSGTPALIPLPE